MNPERDYRDSSSSHSSNSGCNGVCIMSTTWKDEQHPSFINFISSYLDTNSFRLNFVSIDPDFIFNCGGVSVAFIFTTSWDSGISQSIFSKIQKLKEQFAHFFVVVTLPTKDQNDFFIRSYFKHGMEFGRPTFIPVQDLEMGFEKIVKIAHARGGEVAYGDSVVQKNLEVFINHRHFIAVCKRHDAIAKLKAEREKSAQSMDVYIKVVTSIPGIDSHDAIALNQAIGSIEAIAKASKEYILENTDLSTEKAETITRFFRDPKFYLGTKLKMK